MYEQPASYLWLNIAGFVGFNLISYNLIPIYVQRSGATLLNISNVTTIIWSMITDIAIFGERFYPLYVVAFCLEMVGVVTFSLKKPMKPEDKEALYNNE